VNFIVAARKYVRQDVACSVAIATDKRKRERTTEEGEPQHEKVSWNLALQRDFMDGTRITVN
jgi:hypothetical protein